MQSIVFAIPAYFMIHFEFAAEKFFLYLISLILSVLTMTYLGALSTTCDSIRSSLLLMLQFA